MQVTDFENAAFSIFIVLLSRAILSFGLNFYIPISKVCLKSVVVVVGSLYCIGSNFLFCSKKRWTRICNVHRREEQL